MADIINGVQVPFVPVRGVDGLTDKPKIELPKERSFDAVLQEELKEIKFSKHAQERLATRQIQLNDTDMSHLKQAVTRAEEKGAKDSLVLLRDLAFIVSVPNRTVVTAMGGESIRQNVFTNIDSAVVAG